MCDDHRGGGNDHCDRGRDDEPKKDKPQKPAGKVTEKPERIEHRTDSGRGDEQRDEDGCKDDRQGKNDKHDECTDD